MSPDQIIALVAGAAMLLLGWMLYWTSLQVAGGILGGAGGLSLAGLCARIWELSPEMHTVLQAGLLVAGAIVGVFAARILHNVVFFVLGFVTGAIAFGAIIAAGRSAQWEWAESDAALAFGIPAAAVVSGLVALGLSRYLIAISSAFLGALLLMLALDWPWNGLPVLPLWIGGAVLQLHFSRGRRALPPPAEKAN